MLSDLNLGAGDKDLYDILKAGKGLRFSLTGDQEKDSDSRFSDSQMSLYERYGNLLLGVL